MRKKILLAGGTAPFTGPVVHLEEGVWLVEPPTSGKVSLVLLGGEIVETDDLPISLNGPSRVQVIVEEGREVHLDAKRVA